MIFLFMPYPATKGHPAFLIRQMSNYRSSASSKSDFIIVIIKDCRKITFV